MRTYQRKETLHSDIKSDFIVRRNVAEPLNGLPDAIIYFGVAQGETVRNREVFNETLVNYVLSNGDDAAQLNPGGRS